MSPLFNVALTFAVAAALLAPLPARAATQPLLGTDTSFAVLGGSTVTNTGPTDISGDLGLSPGSAVTGFPPGALHGTSHIDDAGSVQAKSDLTTAYNAAAGQPCTSTLTGDLGGRTLAPGVYCYPSAAQLTGTLTLDGGGDPNSLFIFKVGSTLTTASASRVTLVNGGPCGVFWQIGSSATLGTDTVFVGTMLVNTSITLNTRANILPGRALAQTGAVTLDSNHITRPPDTCTLPSTSSATSLSSSPTTSSSGNPVVLSSTVTSGGGTPAGTVRFQDGTTTLTTAALDSRGMASFTTSGMTAGRHTVTAIYSGSPRILTSVSSPVVQTVTGSSTTGALRTPQVGGAIQGVRYGAGLLLLGVLLLLLSTGFSVDAIRRCGSALRAGVRRCS